MKKFMDKNFLLDTPTAIRLYEEHASKLPIIDYHSHIIPSEVAENKGFSNITELLLYSDRSKWSVMRSCGVDEKYITGSASDFEKFREFCRVMPLLIGNPIYHLSHLELQRYFDCNLTINSKNCEKIWYITSEKIENYGWCAKDYLLNSNVKLICTIDDPIDNLDYHKEIQGSGYGVQILPTFHPDMVMNIGRMGFPEYIDRLGKSTGVKIIDYESLCQAYIVSLNRFENLGCRTANHEMDDCFCFCKPDPYHANEVFKKAILNDEVEMSKDEIALWKTQMMRFFGLEYVKRRWILQLNYGVLRKNNGHISEELNCDLEYNMIHHKCCMSGMYSLLNYLQRNNALPKTIIHPINSHDNIAIATLCEYFCQSNRSDIPTVVQGGAWWFNANIGDIENQMKSLSNLASFGNFLGMPTYSGSFVSYPRYEYFRRSICNLIGGWVEQGLYPDYESAADIVERVSLYNVIDYFGFKIDI